MLNVIETGFLKKGTKSVGVHANTVERRGASKTARSGSFSLMPALTGIRSSTGALPAEGVGRGPERRKEAGIPEEVVFATKPELARRMIARAIAAESAVRLGSGR